jgi:hypothetical protein
MRLSRGKVFSKRLRVLYLFEQILFFEQLARVMDQRNLTYLPSRALFGGLISAWVGLLLIGEVHAQEITLGNSSTVLSSATENSVQTQNSNDVTSLPYSGLTSGTEGTAISGVTATLSSSSLNFSFSQTISDPDSSTFGQGEIFFTAGNNVTYTLAGSSILTGSPEESGFYMSLLDLTAQKSVYNSNYDPTSSGTTTFTSSGGPLTGSLTAGDTYKFSSDEALESGSTLSAPLTINGDISVTFSESPEPPTCAMLLGGLGLLAFGHKRRLSVWSGRDLQPIRTFQRPPSGLSSPVSCPKDGKSRQGFSAWLPVTVITMAPAPTHIAP